MAILNGKECIIPDEQNLKAFLEENGIVQTKGIAVAVNQKVVPRQDWESFIISQPDHILVIKAAQGG